MDPNGDLRSATAKYFDRINFSELNDRWIDEVIENEFTEADENNISVGVLFADEPKRTLFKLADLCVAWSQKSNNESVLSNDPNISFDREVLWTILDEMDINAKQIQSVIYLLCSRATKTSASLEEKSLSLACAKLYFSSLRVPGCAAYSIYHTNLFNLCIDCLPALDFITDTSANKQLENLSSVYIPTLLSLIPVLKDVYLGDDSNTLEHAIKKLADLTACEVQNHIQFNFNFLELEERELRRRFKSSLIVSALAYHALSAILDTELNGDKDRNYLIILSFLNKHILCTKARKSPTVSQKILLIKDNAVNYVCFNLQTKDFCSEVTQLCVKRLCLGVTDKTEIRNAVSAAVIVILLNMKPEHLTEMINWILLLIDSADTKDRVFSLDIFSHLLGKTYNADSNQLPDCLKDDSLTAPIIFAILTRCDDISPLVRTKALSILSQNMKCILQFLARTKDQATFEIEDSEDLSNKDLDVNGNHRYFWYNLESFRERLNEIAAILQRRVEDKNVNARKAAVVALENLIVFDLTYITEENLKFFDSAAKDPNVAVRKQVIQSLSLILESYSENVDIQECWLRCVMPLIDDAESGVQSKALSVLEDLFLFKIFSSNQAERECAFALLKLLSSGNFLAHQRYFEKAFSLWKSENKLKPQAIIQLEKYVGTEWEECIWFYISNFAMYKNVPPRISNLGVDQFQNIVSSGLYPSFMEYIMKVLTHVFGNLPLEKSEVIMSIVSETLQSFLVPVALIPIYVDILFRIHKKQNTDEEFARFSFTLIEKCEERLKEIELCKSFPEPPSEDLLAKYFSTIKEFCQLCVSNIRPNVVSVLKSFCVEPPSTLSKVLSPCIKAHAFAALGKICLQDELLAKDMLPVYAKELLTSKYDVIRSNIVIILIEMCKRYTSFADKYVPLISLCFKDKLYLIRYQTIVLVVNLLQEGYIKWRGALFFCLLSTLNDKKEAIQELGRYSLSQLLADKKKNLFSEHFIDSIFVYNNFPPPDNETLAQSVKDLERFSMPGEHRREERMLLYKFLLDSMEMKERMYLVKSICDIIVNVAESVYPLGETIEGIIRDCFAILTCKEIRVFNADQADEESEENNLSKTELEMRKVVIINPVIPVIVSLKNTVTDPESDLMNDIILFLKDLLHDFKDSMKDILAVDKILLRQLELEIKNDVERERAEKRMEKNVKDKNRQVSNGISEDVGPSTLEGIQAMMKDVTQISGEEKEDSDKKDTASKSPSTPRHLSRHARETLQRSVHRAIPSTSRQVSSENELEQTVNIAETDPVEYMDPRLASTPRVILTNVHVPLTRNILNVSGIDRVEEPMHIDSDDD